MNNALDAAGNIIAPNANPLARDWAPVTSDNGTVEGGVLTFITKSGLNYRMSPALDERCKFVFSGTVIAVSERAGEELAREAKAWGVKGVRFAVG